MLVDRARPVEEGECDCGGETGEGEGAWGGEEGSRPGEGEQLLLAAPKDRAGEADRREEETKGLLVAVVPVSAAAGGEQHWMPWRSLTCWMRLQAEVSWAVHRAHRK